MGVISAFWAPLRDFTKVHFFQRLESSAPKINLVDTIGAGDAFFATLIGGMRKQIDNQLLLNKACEVGAKVASQKGATIPL